MQKIDGKSLDLVGENKKKLAEVLGKTFPEVVAEGEVDLDKLALLLGKDKSDPDKLERYNFTWAGKRQSLRLRRRRGLCAPPSANLSTGTQHRISTLKETILKF